MNTLFVKHNIFADIPVIDQYQMDGQQKSRLADLSMIPDPCHLNDPVPWVHLKENTTAVLSP